MPEPIVVDVPGMKAGSASISGKARDVTTHETSTKQTIETLLSTWRGGAADAYRQALEPFYAQCEGVVRILDKLSEDVQTSAVNYENHHQQATDRIQSFAASVPSTPGLSNF